MAETFTYTEGGFSPSEAEACTGLSSVMQRDWRRHGLIPARSSGVALFRPHELAEIRLMVKMRQMGLGPSISRPFAQEAAASVIWLALTICPSSWAVTGPEEVAERYRRHLEKLGDEHLQVMAGLGQSRYGYGIARDQTVQLVAKIAEDELDDEVEVSAVLSLGAVAKALVEAAPRPLMTIIAPPSFGRATP